MKHLTPIGIHVIILPDPPEEMDGHIIKPDSAIKPPLSGRVLEAGKGRPDYKMTVKQGDVVYYPRFGFTETTLQDEAGNKHAVIVIKESELLFAFVEDGAASEVPAAEATQPIAEGGIGSGPPGAGIHDDPPTVTTDPQPRLTNPEGDGC